MFYFSHILGTIIPIDFHIFQRGWNHQPDDITKRSWFVVEWLKPVPQMQQNITSWGLWNKASHKSLWMINIASGKRLQFALEHGPVESSLIYPSKMVLCSIVACYFACLPEGTPPKKWLVVGTFFILHILGIIIPIDFHIFPEGFKPPTRNGGWLDWWQILKAFQQR